MVGALAFQIPVLANIINCTFLQNNICSNNLSDENVPILNLACGGAFIFIPGLHQLGNYTLLFGNITFRNCNFNENFAQGGNGQNGAQALGGSIYTENTHLSLYNCNFTDNFVIGGNGPNPQSGMGSSGAANGGAVMISQVPTQQITPHLCIQNCYFLANSVIGGTGYASSSSLGGALVANTGEIIINNSQFINNTATAPFQSYGAAGNSQGGAISAYVYESLSIFYSTFEGNAASGGTCEFGIGGTAIGGALVIVTDDDQVIIIESCNFYW